MSDNILKFTVAFPFKYGKAKFSIKKLSNWGVVDYVFLKAISMKEYSLQELSKYSKKKINTFASVFPATKPKFVLAVMLDEPKANKEFVYHYRDGRTPYKGNWRNTAGWTTVWVAGQIIEKIGPILATKY